MKEHVEPVYIIWKTNFIFNWMSFVLWIKKNIY